MATYRVAFDGRWQGDFDSDEDAVAWASEVGETGRIAYVVKFVFPARRKLIAIFPDEQRERGKEMWRLSDYGTGV